MRFCSSWIFRFKGASDDGVELDGGRRLRGGDGIGEDQTVKGFDFSDAR
jgi:hypothetical protein